MQQADIGPMEFGEPAFEAGVNAAEESRRLFVRIVTLPVFAFHQHVDQDRHQRARQHVGRQHREHHGQSLRREQVFRRVGQEHHRNEGAADRQRGDQRRLGDAGRALDHRLPEVVAFLQQPIGVLDRDRRIIHQNADRQRKPAQGHDVDRLAQRRQHRQRCQDRQRDGDQHDQG